MERRLLVQFIAFGLLGLITEIVFTSVKGLLTNRCYELKGETSLWMIPIYGTVAILFPPVHSYMGNFQWFVRGTTYMLVFFLVEYASGFVLRKIRVCPWNYPAKYSLNGLIYLPYAPFWFAAGLGLEKIYPTIIAASRIF